MNAELKQLSDRLVALNATSAPDFLRLTAKYEEDIRQRLYAKLAENRDQFHELNGKNNGKQSFGELLAQGSQSAALIGKMFYNSFKLNYGDHSKSAWDQLRNELAINGQLAQALDRPAPQMVRLENLPSYDFPGFIRHIHNQGLLDKHPGTSVPMTTSGFTKMRTAITNQIEIFKAALPVFGRPPMQSRPPVGRPTALFDDAPHDIIDDAAALAQTMMQRISEAFQVLKGDARALPVAPPSKPYKHGLEQAKNDGVIVMREAGQNMQLMRAQSAPEQPVKPS